LVDLIPQFRQQSICNVFHVADDISSGRALRDAQNSAEARSYRRVTVTG
jgi:hypothetical protein